MDIWFYHLEQTPVDKVLPALLERSLERGWKAVVQAQSEERIAALDLALWTYDDASFLAHGTRRDGDDALQPVILTQGAENPNGAAIRFFVEGTDIAASLSEATGTYERVVLLFDGNAPDEIESARRQWTALKNSGHAVSYWQQDEDGRWQKRG